MSYQAAMDALQKDFNTDGKRDLLARLRAELMSLRSLTSQASAHAVIHHWHYLTAFGAIDPTRLGGLAEFERLRAALIDEIDRVERMTLPEADAEVSRFRHSVLDALLAPPPPPAPRKRGAAA